MSRKQVAIFLSFAVFLTLRANGQEKSYDVKEKRITIQMKEKPIHDVFTRLMYVYDIPIGLEVSTLDNDHDDYFFQTLMPPEDRRTDFLGEPLVTSWDQRIKNQHLISLDFKDARLKDVLDEIVRQMRNYDWTTNNDVVNIFPNKGRDPRFEKLLNIKIGGFGLSKGEQLSTIQPTIVVRLPEFRAFLVTNNLHAESDRYLPSYADLPIPEELRFTDLKFKELLNGIIRLKRGGWILRTGDKHKKPENRGREVIEILI